MTGAISTAVAEQAHKPTLATFIGQLRPELARALPKHLDADRIARLALTVVRQTPKLAECSQESFAGALLTASALGLEVGTPEAYLVPYEFKSGARRGQVECQLIIGYQGMAKLFWQSPLASHLDAKAVHERDDFSYAFGLNPHLEHKPATGDRGKVTHYYAVVGLSNGGTHFDVFSPEEIRDLRRGRVGSSGDIPDPQHWMERKTALRQVLKTMPRSTSLTVALNADEKQGSELYIERVREIEGRQVDTTTGEMYDRAELASAGAALAMYPTPKAES